VLSVGYGQGAIAVLDDGTCEASDLDWLLRSSLGFSQGTLSLYESLGAEKVRDIVRRYAARFPGFPEHLGDLLTAAYGVAATPAQLAGYEADTLALIGAIQQQKLPLVMTAAARTATSTSSGPVAGSGASPQTNAGLLFSPCTRIALMARNLTQRCKGGQVPGVREENSSLTPGTWPPSLRLRVFALNFFIRRARFP